MIKPRLAIFIIIVAVQLSVPIYLIANREYVLKTGHAFHFRTEPVDPYDAFRGRYVYLDFAIENDINEAVKKEYGGKVWEALDSDRARTMYVSLKKDARGFAIVATIGEIPPGYADYIKVDVKRNEYSDRVLVDIPFNRFYMDEFDAPKAEHAYNTVNRDQKMEAYAVVYVKKGETVLYDLMLDNMPIREYLTKYSSEPLKPRK
ncbi:MAG: hypothetical protein A2176_12575 [Spirochaetes bacterium RBG_13_51_14]|nr:MAG: hypothetical protein A2176_12575 [Spirochaetes bacterium RBG_13_51_14]